MIYFAVVFKWHCTSYVQDDHPDLVTLTMFIVSWHLIRARPSEGWFFLLFKIGSNFDEDVVTEIVVRVRILQMHYSR
jgi:hypothetical protein